MMRPVLIGIACLVLGGALVLDALAGMQFLPPTIVAAVVLLALLFENRRYQRLADTRPGAPWQATDERFVDPDSGKLVTVYFNPMTGERRYVADRV
jgi:hypothetical protein